MSLHDPVSPDTMSFGDGQRALRPGGRNDCIEHVDAESLATNLLAQHGHRRPFAPVDALEGDTPNLTHSIAEVPDVGVSHHGSQPSEFRRHDDQRTTPSTSTSAKATPADLAAVKAPTSRLFVATVVMSRAASSQYARAP